MTPCFSPSSTRTAIAATRPTSTWEGSRRGEDPKEDEEARLAEEEEVEEAEAEAGEVCMEAGKTKEDNLANGSQLKGK